MGGRVEGLSVPLPKKDKENKTIRREGRSGEDVVDGMVYIIL